MDCISRNGSGFYASSLDSAHVCKGNRARETGKGEGEGKMSVQEHMREETWDRELQHESNDKSSFTGFVCSCDVHVAPIYPQASLVMLPTDVKQKSHAEFVRVSFLQHPIRSPSQALSPFPCIRLESSSPSQLWTCVWFHPSTLIWLFRAPDVHGKGCCPRCLLLSAQWSTLDPVIW